MSSQAPKLSELQALARTALLAHSYYTSKEVEVVDHRGLSDDVVEQYTRDKGAVVVVCPITTVKIRDQAGKTWIVDAEIMVKLRINQDVNSDTSKGGKEVDIYELIAATISALCGRTRHPGGEFFQAGGMGDKQVATLSSFDAGLWCYDMLFTKEAVA